MRVSSCLLLLVFQGWRVCADDGLAPKVALGVGEVDNNRTLIATVFGEPLYLTQVTPANAEVKRKELPPREFDQWLLKYRGRRTYELVWGHAVRRYVEREKLGITDEELDAITQSVERQLQTEEEPPQAAAFTPDERKGMMTTWARGVLMDWKVCRSLYKKYGGRVGIGSLGAWTAFDGQNALLREHYNAGDIKFHHAEMQDAFWQHTKTTNFADAYPKGERLKRLLATPPYAQR